MTRLKRIVAGVILISVAIGVGVGVGVGVGLNRNHGDQDESSLDPDSSWVQNSANQSLWTPANGVLWDYHLSDEVQEISDEIEVYDIDLADTSQETIDELHKKNKRVICYFSAGSYEDWRNDSSLFDQSDLGKPLDGWKGERWLDVRSANVHLIMVQRIELASRKRCDGIDPDNVDTYSQGKDKSGFDISKSDSVNYVKFLATTAHSHNLSIGLKNGPDMVDDLVDTVDFSVVEQCVVYSECDSYLPIAQKGGAILHVEYPKGDDTNNQKNVTLTDVHKYCSFSNSSEFSTILKNMVLDDWLQECN